MFSSSISSSSRRRNQYKGRWPTAIRTYRELGKINVRSGDIPRGVSLINGKVGGNYSLDRDFQFTDSDDIHSILASLASPKNLEIIKREVLWMVARRSLATSPSLLCALEVYYAGEFILRKLTAKSVLLAVLEREIKPSTSTTIIKEQLKNIQLIIEHLIPHSMASVTQYMSDVRVHVLRPSLGPALVKSLAEDHGIFVQDEGDKKVVRAEQQKARVERATHQISVSTVHLNAISTYLTAACKRMISADYKLEHHRIHALHQLLATVMLATGSRLTEVVILSDYVPLTTTTTNKDDDDDDDAGDGIVKRTIDSDNNNFLTISPVAKRKDPTSTKTSDRVILFGLTLHDIQLMVKMIRRLIPMIQENPNDYLKLDKANRSDRAKAIRLVGDFSGFVTDALYGLNSTERFIPRSLRGLYAILSYHQKAIKPTSEIIWINPLLDHALLSTSVHYNVYSLY